MNQPARLRLVVVAPVGRKVLSADQVEGVLEQVLRELGAAAAGDKPRVRVWPPQLSSAGFAPTFFRLTHRPDPAGKPSRWVLLAGPARAGGQPILWLGPLRQALAPLTDWMPPEVRGLFPVEVCRPGDRCTVKCEPDDQPSRWVLVAGRALGGRQPVMLGLGLWAEQPSTVGRLNLEPHQWLDVLRLRPAEK
jgi:hypothetical protein